MLKSVSELKKLDPRSEEIMKKGPIDRYAERPHELEDTCLADFIACYAFRGNQQTIDDADNDLIDEELSDIEENEHDSSRAKSKYKLNDGTLTLRKKRKVIRFCRYDVEKDPENFFRERVMLFKPWRNENDDVENKNCQEIFKENRNIIQKNSCKYIALDIDLNAILFELETNRATADTDNDCDINEDNPQFLNVYDYDDTMLQPNAMFDIGQDIHHASNLNEVKRFTVPDQLRDGEYFQLCDTLNEKQRDYLLHVLNNFKLNDIPLYHFVSGGAGVGKSRLIKAVYQSIIRTYRSEPGPVDSPEVLIVAYTGKAAHNVNGMTAHTAFSLTMVQGKNQETKELGPEALNTLRVKLTNLKLIIIDEISMMGSKIFEQIHHRLCHVFRTKSAFGGRSVIVFGDFQQLRPVNDNYVFQPGRDNVKKLVGNFLWDKFLLFELTEIMRQKEDRIFAEALGRLAKGILTEKDVQMFRSRCFIDSDVDIHGNKILPLSGEKVLPEEGKGATRLMWKNSDVEKYNAERMKQLEDPSQMKITFEAIDKIIGAQNKTEERQAIHGLNALSTQQTHGLPKALILQIGVRYMITSNIDVQDGLFNGATGILKFVELNNRKPYAVYIDFDDANIGKSARADRTLVINTNKNILPHWTPISRIKGQFQTTKRGSVQVSIFI